MLKLFKSFTPQTIIIIIIFTILIKLGYLFHDIDIQEFINANETDWLSAFLLEYLGPHSKLPLLSGMALVIIQAIIVNRLCTEYKLFQQDSFIPAALYILLTSLNPWFNILSAPMISSTIMLFVMNNVLRIQSTSMPKKLMYNCGLFIGLSSIIYWPSLLMTLFVAWSYIVSKKVSMKEIAALLFGMITIIYVVLSAGFLLDIDKNITDHIFSPFRLPGHELFQTYWLSFICIIVLLVFGFYCLNTHFSKIVESTKKMWWSVVIFLIMGLLIPFVQWTHTPVNWHFFLIPATMIISNIWMVDLNKWIRIILFWFTLAGIIVTQTNLL